VKEEKRVSKRKKQKTKKTVPLGVAGLEK